MQSAVSHCYGGISCVELRRASVVQRDNIAAETYPLLRCTAARLRAT